MKTSVKELALQHLNEKYDDTFVYVSAKGNSSEVDTSFYASCERFPDVEIAVRCITQEDGSVLFYDNYLSYVYQEQTSATLTEIIHGIYGEETTAFEYAVYDSASLVSLDGDVSFEEYAKYSASDITLTICVLASGSYADEKEEKLEAFRQALQEANIALSGVIQYFPQEYWDGVLDDFEGNPNRTLGQMVDRCIFQLNDDFEWSFLKWGTT